MRSIEQIKQEVNVKAVELAALKSELNKAQYDAFLKTSGVPNGAKPIFSHKHSGERVLATGFAEHWPIGVLIKKDGTLSEKVTRTIFEGEYTFVGEAESK